MAVRSGSGCRKPTKNPNAARWSCASFQRERTEQQHSGEYRDDDWDEPETSRIPPSKTVPETACKGVPPPARRPPVGKRNRPRPPLSAIKRMLWRQAGVGGSEDCRRRRGRSQREAVFSVPLGRWRPWRRAISSSSQVVHYQTLASKRLLSGVWQRLFKRLNPSESTG